MPKAGYKFSDEAKLRMRLAHLGKKRGPHSPEHRAALSASHKKRIGQGLAAFTEEAKTKAVLAQKTDAYREKRRQMAVLQFSDLKNRIAASFEATGRLASPETREKLSKVHKGKKYRLGKAHTEETKKRMSKAHLERDRPPLSDAERLKRSLAVRSRPAASKETREKMRKSATGRVRSPEALRKQSETMKRILKEKGGHSKEALEKMAEAAIGRTHTAETRSKISMVHRERKHHKHSEETKRKLSKIFHDRKLTERLSQFGQLVDNLTNLKTSVII